MRIIGNLRQDTRGAALVEMSLMLPFLVILMGGMMEFGRGLQQMHVANKGVKNAARYLARIVDDGACPPSSAGWTAAVTKAKTLAQRGSFNASDPYLLSNWQSAGSVTVSVSCVNNASGNYRGKASLPMVEVSTTFPFNDVGILSLLNITSLNITASHEQMYIGG